MGYAKTLMFSSWLRLFATNIIEPRFVMNSCLGLCDLDVLEKMEGTPSFSFM